MRTYLLPFKLLEVKRRFGGRAFDLLDVGCGNHSPSMTCQWLSKVRYDGVDRERDYANDANDWALVRRFFELDLTTLDFAAIPDAAYDVIMVAHVIEHLANGDDVLRALVPKLRPGGMIHVEFPGPRSLRLPSKRGCLNFRDDPTHVRVYTATEVAVLLDRVGLRVDQAGTRRDWRAIALMPLRALKSKRDHGYVGGSVFWDLLGFADYVIATRPGAPA